MTFPYLKNLLGVLTRLTDLFLKQLSKIIPSIDYVNNAKRYPLAQEGHITLCKIHSLPDASICHVHAYKNSTVKAFYLFWNNCMLLISKPASWSAMGIADCIQPFLNNVKLSNVKIFNYQRVIKGHC